VDVWSDINLNEFIDFHYKTGSLATLAVRNRETSRYFLFDDEGILSGWRNVVKNEEIIDEWLRSLGVQFDPFRILNAGEDNRLHEYLVSHKTFEAIQTDRISFIFAPAGGGKSAFRVRLARACRTGEAGRRLFPIFYALPQTVIQSAEQARFSAHLRAILAAAAQELFLRLAYRPHEFTGLDQTNRQTVRFLLEYSLPGSLQHRLDQLQTAADLPSLAQPYDPTAHWPKPPTPTVIREFCRAVETTTPAAKRISPNDAFNLWQELLLESLGFEAVYLLLDGVDAYPETLTGGQEALAVLRPLLEWAGDLSGKKVYLKAFLSAELEAPLTEAFPALITKANIARIEWTPELLANLLKRRLETATEAAPASLDMLAYPGMRNTDQRVVEAVKGKPFPREVLSFVERLFLEHIQRVGQPAGKLTRQDLEAADAWYRANLPN